MPLIMSVARVRGILPRHVLSSRSLAGFANKGVRRTMSLPRMKGQWAQWQWRRRGLTRVVRGWKS